MEIITTSDHEPVYLYSVGFEANNCTHRFFYFSDLFHPLLLIADTHSKLELITFGTVDKKWKGSYLMKTEQELCLGTSPNGIQSLPLC